MATNKVQFGIEFEGLFKRTAPIFSFSSEELDEIGFNRKDDGSLRYSSHHNRSEWYKREVTTPIFDLNEAQDTLNQFKGLVQSNPEDKLSNNLFFNKSTGTHIHFSLVSDSGALRDCAIGTLLKRIDDRVKEENKKFFTPNKYGIWVNHFVRNYSREQDYSQLNRSDKYRTFNLSNDEYKTIEYRSFNLRGVRTWQNFFNVVMTTLKIIDEEVNKAIKTGMERLNEEGIEEEDLSPEFNELNKSNEIYESGRIRENTISESELISPQIVVRQRPTKKESVLYV